MSYFERCQDWLDRGEGNTVVAVDKALQGIQRKLAVLTDTGSDEYQDLECTVNLLQDQLELLANPKPDMSLSKGGEVSLDLGGLHPEADDPLHLSVTEKAQVLDTLLSNPLLAKGMPKNK